MEEPPELGKAREIAIVTEMVDRRKGYQTKQEKHIKLIVDSDVFKNRLKSKKRCKGCSSGRWRVDAKRTSGERLQGRATRVLGSECGGSKNSTIIFNAVLIPINVH